MQSSVYFEEEQTMFFYQKLKKHNEAHLIRWEDKITKPKTPNPKLPKPIIFKVPKYSSSIYPGQITQSSKIPKIENNNTL